MHILSKSLAVFSWAVFVTLPSAGSSQTLDDGKARANPQAAEGIDFPTDLTRQEWKLRVEQSKLRAKQFSLLAKAGLLKPLPRSAEERALEASSAVLNDQGLRPGDIVSTISGSFVYRGRYGSDPNPNDFVPVSPNFLNEIK